MERLPLLDRGLALIGLPACGKSTVARRLARLTGLPALDLDDLIAQEASLDIPSIFAREGEAGFRERESGALRRAAEGRPVILATGGGIILRPGNRRLLKEHFVTVWLKVLPTTAASRSMDGSRPLLDGGNTLTKMETLESVRRPLYEESADIVVDTEGRDLDEIAREIYDKIR